MTKKTLLLAAPLLVMFAVAGCAQPQTTPTADNVPPPATQAAPEPKTTAAAPDVDRCFDDLGFSAEQEHRGGDVSWPEPLTDDQIDIEPSCWAYSAASDTEFGFVADWLGITSQQRDQLDAQITAIFTSAGYDATSSSDLVDEFSLDSGDGGTLHATVTRGPQFLRVEAGRGNG